MAHIVVIGGGIVGLSSAFYLRKTGHNVTIIDKTDITNNCSYGNAGYICPSHFVPLASPGIVKQGLRWMLNSSSPFYIQPRLNWGLIDWGLKFIKSATPQQVENAAIPLRDIAILSKKMYEEWISEEGLDLAYEQKGLLEIFQTEAKKEHAKHLVEKAQELGLTDTIMLSYDELQAMEPQTKIDAMGAVYFKCDAHAYPQKLMQAIIGKLKQLGVQFRLNEEVIGFEKQGKNIRDVITNKQKYSCDEVVIASGSWSRELTKKLDINIPLVGGRGYSVTLENSEHKLNYPAVLMEGRAALTPMDGNKIRFGGTMEITNTNTPPRINRVEGLLKAVQKFYPSFKIETPPIEKVWYGFRPCSADGLPYIGKTSKYHNLTIATGHAMVGFSLGAGTGKLVSEIVNNQPSSMDISAFKVQRWG
jgi:D-amino-acid dehydrogenase